MRKFIPILLAAVLAPAPSMAQENSTRPPPRILQTIPLRPVLEIRKLSAADATTNYGKDQNGVILVTVITSAPR